MRKILLAVLLAASTIAATLSATALPTSAALFDGETYEELLQDPTLHSKLALPSHTTRSLSWVSRSSGTSSSRPLAKPSFGFSSSTSPRSTEKPLPLIGDSTIRRA